MKKTPFLILFLLISQIIFAQITTQIKGLVKSSDGNLLSNATITIFFNDNNLLTNSSISLDNIDNFNDIFHLIS